MAQNDVKGKPVVRGRVRPADGLGVILCVRRMESLYEQPEASRQDGCIGAFVRHTDVHVVVVAYMYEGRRPSSLHQNSSRKSERKSVGTSADSTVLPADGAWGRSL